MNARRDERTHGVLSAVAGLASRAKRARPSSILALAGAITFVGAAEADAQSGPDAASPPSPTVSRFDEGWATFCENRPEDAPAFKCLNLGDATVSIGSDARIRYEVYDPTAFGRGPQDADGYWLVRASGHADLTLTPHWRAFGQLFAANVVDRNGGARPADRNELDVVQGFVEWRPRGDDDAYVRFGRQEIAFGAGRLFAASEGSNVRRQFDGLRAGLRVDDINYQIVATGLVQVRPGAFDDSASLDRSVFGVGAVHATASGQVSALYFIHARRPERVFGAPASIQDRSTLGGRVVRQSQRWFGELEVIGQSGEADGLNVAAWAVAGEVARQWRATDPQVRVSARFSAASGDRNPGDGALNGFDPLFPNPSYTGSVPLIGPTNTIALNPRMSISWPSSWRLSGDVAVMRRLSSSDSVYAFSGVAIPAAAEADDAVGALWSLSIARQLASRWNASATAAYFDAGNYFRRVNGADTRFVTVNLSYAY